LQDRFVHWLEDPEPHVERAAALALLQPEYRAKAIFFASALKAPAATVRANAAWALGKLGSPEGRDLVRPLLADDDATVRAEAYLALSRLTGNVPATALLQGLADAAPAVRGAAALALAQHPAPGAVGAIDAQLEHEMHAELSLYQAYNARQAKTLSREEIAAVTTSFRCQMEMVKALAKLSGTEATTALQQQAFRPGADFSQMNGLLAAFALWDRIGGDPDRAIEALGSSDPGVQDRAEWMLAHAGPEALPAVRAALKSPADTVRLRAMRIVSLTGDVGSLPLLRTMCDGSLGEQAKAAIVRIETLQAQ
jgi:glycerophosphoryl diester phosphodiesterase